MTGSVALRALPSSPSVDDWKASCVLALLACDKHVGDALLVRREEAAVGELPWWRSRSAAADGPALLAALSARLSWPRRSNTSVVSLSTCSAVVGGGADESGAEWSGSGRQATATVFFGALIHDAHQKKKKNALLARSLPLPAAAAATPSTLPPRCPDAANAAHHVRDVLDIVAAVRVERGVLSWRPPRGGRAVEAVRGLQAACRAASLAHYAAAAAHWWRRLGVVRAAKRGGGRKVVAAAAVRPLDGGLSVTVSPALAPLRRDGRWCASGLLAAWLAGCWLLLGSSTGGLERKEYNIAVVSEQVAAMLHSAHKLGDGAEAAAATAACLPPHAEKVYALANALADLELELSSSLLVDRSPLIAVLLDGLETWAAVCRVAVAAEERKLAHPVAAATVARLRRWSSTVVGATANLSVVS